MDWKDTFSIDTPLLEIFIRGTVVYLGIFFLLRFTLRRESGTIAMSDLLLMVLLADAAQNALTSEYRSVTSGLLIVATLIFWNFALDFLSYRSKVLFKIIHPSPLPLIKNGNLLRKNLAVEYLREEELRSLLREQGVEQYDEVKSAFLESNGRLSVVRFNGENEKKARDTPL